MGGHRCFSIPPHECFQAVWAAKWMRGDGAHRMRLRLAWQNSFSYVCGIFFCVLWLLRRDPDRGVQLLAGKWEDGTADGATHFKGKLLRLSSGACWKWNGRFSAVCSEGVWIVL